MIYHQSMSHLNWAEVILDGLTHLWSPWVGSGHVDVGGSVE